MIPRQDSTNKFIIDALLRLTEQVKTAKFYGSGSINAKELTHISEQLEEIQRGLTNENEINAANLHLSK